MSLIELQKHILDVLCMKVVSVLISKYRFKYWLSDFHENHSLLQTFLGKMLQTTEDSVFKLRVALIGKLTGPFTIVAQTSKTPQRLLETKTINES